MPEQKSAAWITYKWSMELMMYQYWKIWFTGKVFIKYHFQYFTELQPHCIQPSKILYIETWLYFTVYFYQNTPISSFFRILWLLYCEYSFLNFAVAGEIEIKRLIWHSLLREKTHLTSKKASTFGFTCPVSTHVKESFHLDKNEMVRIVLQ